jgi:hypothetical protein
MRSKVALLIGAFVLALAPAMALAAAGGKSGEHKADPTPGPKAGLPAKAKAYGRYCKDASRKHVKGEKGTEFSRCVTAMAKAANSERMKARRACKGLSKKHVKGEKGTEFSRCVVAAAHLRRDEKRQQRQEEKEQKEAESKE